MDQENTPKPKNAKITYRLINRRLRIERRQFSYSCCIPERRSGFDRRRRQSLHVIPKDQLNVAPSEKNK